MEDGILHFPEGVRGDDVGTGLVGMVALREDRKTATSVSNRIWKCWTSKEISCTISLSTSQCNMRQPQHISTLRIPLEWPYLLSARQRTMPDWATGLLSQDHTSGGLPPLPKKSESISPGTLALWRSGPTLTLTLIPATARKTPLRHRIRSIQPKPQDPAWWGNAPEVVLDGSCHDWARLEKRWMRFRGRDERLERPSYLWRWLTATGSPVEGQSRQRS